MAKTGVPTTGQLRRPLLATNEDVAGRIAELTQELSAAFVTAEINDRKTPAMLRNNDPIVAVSWCSRDAGGKLAAISWNDVATRNWNASGQSTDNDDQISTRNRDGAWARIVMCDRLAARSFRGSVSECQSASGGSEPRAQNAEPSRSSRISRK
jgi:hypothetical protein